MMHCGHWNWCCLIFLGIIAFWGLRFSCCLKMESQNGNKHWLFTVWASTKPCAPQQHKTQGWEQQRGHRKCKIMMLHHFRSWTVNYWQWHRGLRERSILQWAAFCQGSCQAGKGWCFTLDPRLTQRLSEFQRAKAWARGWPCCATAWTSARWALSCPMASGPQHKLELLWFHSRDSLKRAWQDVCSPKSQTPCRREKRKKCLLPNYITFPAATL